MTLRSAIKFLTASAALVIAYANVRPEHVEVPRGILPISFGICLGAFVCIDGCRRGSPFQFLSQPSAIRRSSRLIYLWLYLLAGVNELIAWQGNYPFEPSANNLGGFLLAGFVVLVLIRIPRLYTLDRPAF